DALAELRKLLALAGGQSVVALVEVKLRLLDPVAQRLLRDAEALGDVADRATGTDQPDGVAAEILGIRRPRLGHCGHPSCCASRRKRSGVHQTGGSPGWAKPSPAPVERGAWASSAQSALSSPL